MNKQLLYNNKQIFTSFTISFVLYATLKNNIFDDIHVKAPNLKQLKEHYPKFLLMDTLIQILERLNLVEFRGENIFLTEEGLQFTEYHEHSLKPSAMFALDEGVKSWMHLHEAIGTGDIPFTLAFERQPFEYFSDNAESFERFALSMGQSTKRKDLRKILELIKVEDAKTVVDVGCGDGTLLRQVAKLWDYMNVIGFDLPYVVKRTSEMEDNKGIKFVEGDFFKDKVPQADIFILSRILHDWDNEKSKEILTNIKNSMSINSKLIVLDKVIDHKLDDLDTLLSHLNVWVMCGGKERSLNEFEELFTQSGLKIYNFSHIGNIGLYELILN